jgi:hypothetical protein
MNWKTIYVMGRGEFLEDVLKHLGRSGIEFMAGYNSRQSMDSYELFWLPESMELREFKEAIGAKTVFRYRLRFFSSLEEFVQRRDNIEFTAEDKLKIARMRETDRAA